MIKKISIILFFFTISVQAQEISFNTAWQKLLEHSEVLKTKKEDVKIAEFGYDIASDLDFPNVNLLATYTHLDKPIEYKTGDLDLSVDKNALRVIISGVAKGAGNSAFNEALNAGKSQAQALIIAQNTTNEIVSSFSKIRSDLQNTSLELSKQDIFFSSINLTYPIFTGGKIQAAKGIAKGKIKEANALFDIGKQKQFEDLVHVYFGVVLSKEVYKNKKDVVDALDKHYEHSIKLFKQGQIAKIETLTAKARLDKAKVDAKKSKSEYEIAQIALTSLLHEKTLVDVQTKLFTNTKLPNMHKFLKKTLSFYPALDLLRAKQNQANNLIKARKSNYLPNIFLFGSYNLYEDKSPLSKTTPDWLVGLGMNYSIIDSKGREGRLNIAYSKKLKLSYMYENAKRELSVLVKKSYKSIKQALEEYEGLNSSITLGKESVRLRKKSFSQGFGTSLDVIDAELFLQSVKTQRLVASYKYILSLSKLLSLSNEIEKFSQYERTE